MTATATTPERRTVAELSAAYAAEVAAKRRRFLQVVALFAIGVLAAGWLAEVDIPLFIANIHRCCR